MSFVITFLVATLVYFGMMYGLDRLAERSYTPRSWSDIGLSVSIFAGIYLLMMGVVYLFDSRIDLRLYFVTYTAAWFVAAVSLRLVYANKQSKKDQLR